MSEDYWDGALWVYQADITNDAMDIAAQSYTVVPGAGNEMEILYGELFNGDTSSRVADVTIDDGANELGRLLALTANAASRHGFSLLFTQTAAGGPASAGPRYIIAGTTRLVANVASVAVSQDTAFGLVCWIRGGVPTVTEAATAGVPVISINTEQVF